MFPLFSYQGSLSYPTALLRLGHISFPTSVNNFFKFFILKTRQRRRRDRVHPIPPEFFTQRHAPSCAYAVLAVISDCYPQYEAGYPRVTHPSATKIKTTSTEVSVKSISVRLACVKHAASVHPEPGSNSLIKCVCNSAMPASASLLITG